jgi:hypothetical protein
MRRSLFALASAVGVFLIGAVAVFGCGDKFVVLGRGVRFQRVYTAAHPASILIYMNPASHMPAADKEFQLQAILKLAGHKASVVEDANELPKLLTSRSYDVVLADLSDVNELSREAGAASSKPTVIPVIYNPTGAEARAAEKQYKCLVKASKKNNQLLAIIDEAMLGKLKGTATKCNSIQ